MDLEQRVQALEQELQVLKNQIQATLLDIQETLLTNKYPSLRAEEAPAARNIKVAAPQPTQMPDDLAEAPAPNIRRVSLNDLAVTDDEEEANYPRPRPNPAGRPGNRAARVTEQSSQVENRRRVSSIPEAAPQRTAKPAYADEPTRPHRPEELPTTGRTPPPRPKAGKRPQSPATIPQSARQTAPPVPPVATEDEDSHHNLVLKLIAGVANAGVNNRRKKSG